MGRAYSTHRREEKDLDMDGKILTLILEKQDGGYGLDSSGSG
jgi:hypothetical protein